MLGTLPHDIERACLDQVKAVYSARQQNPTIRSEKIPDVYEAAYSVAGGSSFGKSGLLVTVEGALDAHRWMTV